MPQADAQYFFGMRVPRFSLVAINVWKAEGSLAATAAGDIPCSTKYMWVLTPVSHTLSFNQMVESSLQLNLIFGSLADPTRRDILKRAAKKELSIQEIAEYYDMSYAAVSKHVSILEKAKLILKRRRGKELVVQIVPSAVRDASTYLKNYEKLWNARFDRLEQYLASS